MIFDSQDIALIMALPHESQNYFEKMNIPVHYSGIGKVNAAHKTTEIILTQKPKHIINLGTAGSHKILPHTLVEIFEFLQRDLEYTPFDDVAGKISVPTFLPHLQQVICGTGDNVETAAKNHYDIMDMEAYAMAKVCKKMNVGFTSIKYITDQSNSETLKDWKTSLPKAAQTLLEVYKLLVK